MGEYIFLEEKYRRVLPSLPREELDRRLQKVVPFRRFGEDKLKECWVIKINGFDTAYTWERERTGEFLGLSFGFNEDILERITGEDNSFRTIFPTKTYVTQHTFGYHGLFKPTLIEVVSQLPAALFDHEKVYITTEPYMRDKADYYPLGVDCDIHLGLTTVAVKQ